jgi:hypothetical protein
MTPLHFTNIQADARRADLFAAAERRRVAQKRRQRSRTEHLRRDAEQPAVSRGPAPVGQQGCVL